jgi:hypothetical protein
MKASLCLSVSWRKFGIQQIIYLKGKTKVENIQFNDCTLWYEVNMKVTLKNGAFLME